MSYLFSVRGAATNDRSLVAVRRQEVVADLRVKCFEHTNIKPHCFIWILLNVEVRIDSLSLEEVEWRN